MKKAKRHTDQAIAKMIASHRSPEALDRSRKNGLRQARDGKINTSGLIPGYGLKRMHEINRGNHGFGRVERGNIDHANAKAWHVRSPSGIDYKFRNAREWCRKNIHLFSDHNPESKTPLWLRATRGFSSLGSKNGQACSWCGWTLVSYLEDGDFICRRVIQKAVN